MDEAELERMDAEIAEIVTFNARRAFVELPRLYRERLDPALVEAIIEPARRA
jgi:hypothetical protein